MDIFGILTLIGGLALFLYGMSTMGDGLVMLSGGKLERVLEKLTKKRIMALLLGAGVTAVIQSSSATTVMVVGFVNSGIMKLTQAVGIIMGANIGTTVTSWLLSLTGISSGNVFIRLLKPSSFSPVLAAIGIICLMTGKDGSGRKTLGSILLGFAVLMFVDVSPVVPIVTGGVIGVIAKKAGDRGALRVLTWGGKGTMSQKAVLERYLQEGDAMLKGQNIYVCPICGFIYIGTQAPEKCPVCSIPPWRFEVIKEGE